ncbi:antibiotic biosynthesis monooxygenase [Polaribacter litorisediminis]|uniref:antibiotic biosynthesis monooxygenase family protein n=1 Tax=Polaribacter litorisediminis TaxID=1908341 RepID=UPI001CC106BF|nr:antibiotic biosynthesis monooxygenase [Polaribacter litorisediminis]UAM99248.1 antibiotic biosynthesis monooxygenase [Polaribacter litorisediminis]
MIVTNLKPPYFAVIFSTIVEDSLEGYLETADRMEELAKQQNGFLGMESARTEIGITVSYWQTEEDIIAWKNNIEHTEARILGREKWYKQYQLRICKVEREYGFKKFSL